MKSKLVKPAAARRHSASNHSISNSKQKSPDVDVSAERRRSWIDGGDMSASDDSGHDDNHDDQGHRQRSPLRSMSHSLLSHDDDSVDDGSSGSRNDDRSNSIDLDVSRNDLESTRDNLEQRNGDKDERTVRQRPYSPIVWSDGEKDRVQESKNDLDLRDKRDRDYRRIELSQHREDYFAVATSRRSDRRLRSPLALSSRTKVCIHLTC